MNYRIERISLFLFLLILAGYCFFYRRESKIGDIVTKNEVNSKAKKTNPFLADKDSSELRAESISQRNIDLNFRLKGLHTIDVSAEIHKILSETDGRGRQESLLYLVRHVGRTGQIEAMFSFIDLLHQGEDRRTVIPEIGVYCSDSQMERLCAWCNKNLLPDEGFSISAGLLRAKPSVENVISILKFPKQFETDRASLLNSCGRILAGTPEGDRNLDQLFKLLSAPEGEIVVKSFFEVEIFDKGPDAILKLDSLSLTDKGKEATARSAGIVQGSQRGGREGYEWAARQPDTLIRNAFIEGIVSGWISKDLQSASAYLTNVEAGPVRDTAIVALVKRLRGFRDFDSAKSWAGQIQNPILKDHVEGLVKEQLSNGTHPKK